MESTEEDIIRELQVRMSLAQVLEKKRSAVAEPGARAVRERPARRSPRPSRTRRSSSRRSSTCSTTGSSRPSHLPFPTGGRRRGGGKDSLTKQYVKKAAEAIYKDLVRKKIAVEKRRPDGRSETEIRQITCEVVGQPAHARLRPVHARPDADHVAAHARHRQGGPADRRPLAREGSPLHAPLQLPAVLGRGDRAHDRARAGATSATARSRSGRSRRSSRRRGRLPVHDPDRLRDARVERLVVDGLGLRLDARADGRRRADQGAGLGHRDGPRQGGRRLRHPHRHPGRRGSPRRHGLQGRRHPRGHHRAPDGHQDHGRLARDHGAGARRRRRRRASAILDRMLAGDRRAAHAARRATRRGSRPSRSTPSTSAW